jgi:plastocyanin
MSTTRNRALRRRQVRLLGAAALALLLAGPAVFENALAGEAATQVAAAPATVTIDKFMFAPAVLTVTAGTTVTWTNADHTPHTIADKNKAFRSAALDTGDSFTHTFATPGEYSYNCTLHPQMVGKIIVKPAGSS